MKEIEDETTIEVSEVGRVDVPSEVGGSIEGSKEYLDVEVEEVVKNKEGEIEECVLSEMGEDTLDQVAQEEGGGKVGVLSEMGEDTLDHVAHEKKVEPREVSKGILSTVGESTCG